MLLAYLVLMVTAGLFFVRHQNLPGFLVSVFGLNAILIAICFWKGEPPKWQWGNTK